MHLDSEADIELKCDHCDESIDKGMEILSNEHVFCCHGCKTVYQILGKNGLTDFYKIRDDEGVKSNPVTKKKIDYSYMDDDSFIKEFTQVKKQNKQIKFYLEGIHCMACLWLIEKTPSFIQGLISARLNISDSTATFDFSDELNISDLAQDLSRLGYIPHPLKMNESSSRLQKKEERRELLRIGVAGAAMGNIMLYAISNYAGADGYFRTIFNWINLVIAIPVIFYSALPFYKTSIQAIKMRTLSIDIPLSIAMLGGFFFSTFSMFTGGEALYFDSITALVFLILLSRYFVKKATQSGLSTKGLQTFFTNKGVLRRDEQGNFSSVHGKYIQQADTVKILTGEKIIFDIELESVKAVVDNSIITGESKPQEVTQSETLFAGAINIGPEIIARVKTIGDNTRIGKIIKEIESSSQGQGRTVLKADKIAKYFIALVLVLTTLIFAYSYVTYGLQEAIARALAVIIISCPCALAMATPLSFIKSLGQLKARGVLVKNESVLEKINEVKHIILDKTGTLTAGKFEVLSFKNDSQLADIEIHSIVNAIESRSIHPIALSLKSFLQRYDLKTIETKNFVTINGMGIKSQCNDVNYFLGKIKISQRDEKFHNLTQVGLYNEDTQELLATYALGDKLKDGAKENIQKLIKKNFIVHIASGDNTGVVSELGSELGIQAEYLHAEQSPEDKAELIANIKARGEKVLMVGDGANDALALQKANIGIAVGGAVDLSLRASDIFLSTSNISVINDLITTAKETNNVIVRNFIFSISYNTVGVLLALNGFVSPLLAAIFMPASSLTVVLSSYLGTRKPNRCFKGEVL